MACTLMANAEEVFRLALFECGSCPGGDHPFAATCLSNLADCARYFRWKGGGREIETRDVRTKTDRQTDGHRWPQGP